MPVKLNNTLISTADEKWESVTPVSGEQLISKLSFSHIAELLRIDDNLFVSKYQLELPKKEDMQRFIEDKLQEIN